MTTIENRQRVYTVRIYSYDKNEEVEHEFTAGVYSSLSNAKMEALDYVKAICDEGRYEWINSYTLKHHVGNEFGSRMDIEVQIESYVLNSPI